MYLTWPMSRSDWHFQFLRAQKCAKRDQRSVVKWHQSKPFVCIFFVICIKMASILPQCVHFPTFSVLINTAEPNELSMPNMLVLSQSITKLNKGIKAFQSVYLAFYYSFFLPLISCVFIIFWEICLWIQRLNALSLFWLAQGTFSSAKCCVTKDGWIGWSAKAAGQ